MHKILPKREESDHEARSVSAKRAAPKPAWKPKFRIGEAVRTLGGGGSYGRGEVVEVMREEKYYRMDYGREFPSLIREENLSLYDGKNPLSNPPKSFVPLIIPFS